MSVFDTFTKKHDYLVCVDSDGCAMDTMDCKHFHCFGPCMVAEWELEEWREPILFRWNEVNLYQMTRGINRFKALALCLKEISKLNKAVLKAIKVTEEKDFNKKNMEHISEMSGPTLEKFASAMNGIAQTVAEGLQRFVQSNVFSNFQKICERLGEIAYGNLEDDLLEEEDE